MFFLVSGFVVPFSIHAESAAPVGGFAIRRFFRILPAYWLSVPLAAFGFFWIAGLPFSAGKLLVNLSLLQDIAGVRPAEGVYWTLLVELVSYALCVTLLLGRPDAMLATHKLPTYTIAYALGFVAFVAGTRFARIETQLTDWFGQVSDSIYLLHPIVAELVYLALVRQPADSPWRTQHLAVYLVGVAALTLCAASLAYRFVEAPAIRLGHRIAARWERGAGRSRAGLARDAEPATT